MAKRVDADALKTLLRSAADEARRRGDRRLGTDHLLLGLLHDPSSAQALGVSVESARAASDALDTAALAAVGIEVDRLGAVMPGAGARHLPPLTSGTRAVLKAAIEQARPRRTGRIGTDHFALALLEREVPDPAAELLRVLGVDPAEVRARISSARHDAA
jgi:ATP-dependent Clp protease ATP-binding subunit ClpA